ncbi:DUF4339 domain-containing protein [Rosistilla oblonga]|uniref:DUF4339 domain-containing protein n=1 Tax=Rosistilla oblonga TaxID=2527990 RepID=UPI003A97C486
MAATERHNEWFYEYDGKKFGPVHGATLKHLARHGAVTQESRVWKGGDGQAVKAEQISNLFPHVERNSLEMARTLFGAALEASRDEDIPRLKSVRPVLHFLEPWHDVLVEYEVLCGESLTVPKADADGETTKPVKNIFEFKVQATLVPRPASGGSLEQLRRFRPNARNELFSITGKEFVDGSWFFMRTFG